MADRREVAPRQRRSSSSTIGTHAAGDAPPITWWSPYGQHDHVAGLGPVPFAVVARDPAGAASDDVEQDHALGTGVEQVGERRRRRLERERLGELGAEEDRALESQLLERRVLQERCRG